MKALSPRDLRRVWGRARDLFKPKSWVVSRGIEDYKVEGALVRELRLADHRTVLLTDAGLTAFRATVAFLDELDVSDGLAAYSDLFSACRHVLEDCLSNGVEPEDGAEYVDLVAKYIDPAVCTYTYTVPIFGVELDGIDELTLGSLTIRPRSKCIIENLGLKYSAEHLDLAIEQMKPHLWLIGSARGTATVSKENFVACAKLATGVLAMVAASLYKHGSHGFRIGAITTPEEGHGRAVSLSWNDKDMELVISRKSVRAQRLKLDAGLRASVIGSPTCIRAIGILESHSRTEFENAWVKALFWYSDAHRDQTPVMRFLKFWSCVETFFSGHRIEISESVSSGLARTLVYGDFPFFEPSEYEDLKKRIRRMYDQRSVATHQASHSHVSEKDAADLSQWIAWMLLNMVAFSSSDAKTPDDVARLLQSRMGSRRVRPLRRFAAALWRLRTRIWRRFAS